MKTIRIVLACLLVLVLSPACDLAAKTPPVELSFRGSLVGAGNVIQIKNVGNEKLTAVEVRIKSPAGEERIYTEPALESYGTFEIGWKKLGGWQIPDGAEIEVKCEGYLLPFAGTVE